MKRRRVTVVGLHGLAVISSPCLRKAANGLSTLRDDRGRLSAGDDNDLFILRKPNGFSPSSVDYNLGRH